jgi:hypothetical protein
MGQPFDMRLARRNVMQEKLAVEHDIVAGEKLHDARIDLDVGFLP